MYSANGETKYLLSNNMSWQDREKIANLYSGMRRVKWMANFGGMFLAWETIMRVPYFKGMAAGWKFMSFFGLAFAYRNLYQAGFSSQYYGPLISAYFKKYQEKSKSDMFDITDRKREYYQIDTSVYMNYDYSDLNNEYHYNHGPQPVITPKYNLFRMDKLWLHHGL